MDDIAKALPLNNWAENQCMAEVMGQYDLTPVQRAAALKAMFPRHRLAPFMVYHAYYEAHHQCSRILSSSSTSMVC